MENRKVNETGQLEQTLSGTLILVGFIKEGKVGNSLTMFMCSIAGAIVNLCVSILLIALLTSQRGFV